MEKRKLGKSGIEFAPIAFGGNVFGWTADEATSHRLLDAFVDAGFSFIDTADVYSRWVPGHKGGESEAIIGSWLKKNPGKRAKVQIATKCGMEMPSEGQFTAALAGSDVNAASSRWACWDFLLSRRFGKSRGWTRITKNRSGLSLTYSRTALIHSICDENKIFSRGD